MAELYRIAFSGEDVSAASQLAGDPTGEPHKMPNRHEPDVLGKRQFIEGLKAAAAPSPTAAALVEELTAYADEFYGHQRAENTLKAYEARLKPWYGWCEMVGLPPLRSDPDAAASQVALFVMWLGKHHRFTAPNADDVPVEDAGGEPYAISTMRGILTAIGKEYVNNNHPNPIVSETVSNTMDAYARQFGRPQQQAHALSLEQLETCCVTLGLVEDAKQHARDKLMVLLLTDPQVKATRAEIVELRWTDLHLHENGLEFSTSRGNRHHAPASDDEDLDPVRATQAWSQLADSSCPYVFPGASGDKPMSSQNAGANILERHVSAVSRWVHHPGGGTSLEPLTFMPGLKRGQNKLLAPERRLVIQTMSAPSPAGLRDRALMTTGWWAQLRASELSKLCWRDVDVTDATVTLRLSAGTKTDPNQIGEIVCIERNAGATDPGTALQEWRTVLEQQLGRPVRDEEPVLWGLHTSGPTCNERRDELTGRTRLEGLTTEGINDAIKRAAERANVTPDPNRRLTSHALRAGGATEMILAGHTDAAVAHFGRRKTTEGLQRYYRPGTSSAGGNPTSGLVDRRIEQAQEEAQRRHRNQASQLPE